MKLLLFAAAEEALRQVAESCERGSRVWRRWTSMIPKTVTLSPAVQASTQLSMVYLWP